MIDYLDDWSWLFDWSLFHFLCFVLKKIIEHNTIIPWWFSVSILFLENYQRVPSENGKCPRRTVGKFRNTMSWYHREELLDRESESWFSITLYVNTCIQWKLYKMIAAKWQALNWSCDLYSWIIHFQVLFCLFFIIEKKVKEREFPGNSVADSFRKLEVFIMCTFLPKCFTLTRSNRD